MAHGDSRPLRHSRFPSRTAGSSGVINRASTRSTLASKATIDQALTSYIKRVLCSGNAKAPPLENAAGDDLNEKSLEELLPPLTSSNDVDTQLYGIIAVILQQFVQTWYNKITPDADFVGEIVQIIAHCTRGIEDRLRQTDLEALLLDEVSGLLDDHVAAVQISRSVTCGTRDNAGWVFSTLRPHPALRPPPSESAAQSAQQENEISWCQAHVDRVIALLLPPEDLMNPCLNVLVQEIFTEMIMHNAICGKLSEPWLLWEGITKLVSLSLPKDPIRNTGPIMPINRLEQFGLLTSEGPSRDPRQLRARRKPADAISHVFWSILQHIMVASTLLRAFVTALMQVESVPHRSSRAGKSHPSEKQSQIRDSTRDDQKAIVEMRVWGSLGRLMSLHERMPWLSGLLSLVQRISLHGTGQVCRTDSALDRLLSAQVHLRLLNPALLPPVLQATRSAVFPDNTLAPPRVPPTSDEVLEIKRECAKAIIGVIPGAMRSIYFATQDVALMQHDVERTLELFEDAYINKHLVVALVDLLVVRLFPEVGRETWMS